MVHSFPRSAAALALAAGIATPALAQFEREYEPERPDMPPGRRLPTQTSPPFCSVTDTNTMVQVNINAAGLNIVGDAANEPSIAIDPLAPNRMIIGWRQFDTITSNFRQAGLAWSVDGGRHWTNTGGLTPGQWRSDPVVETDSAGRFFYMTIPDTTAGWSCELFKSPDGGHTWAAPTLANGGDREWMSIDKTGGIGDGNIYNDWNANFSCCGTANFGRDTSHGALPWPAPFTAPNNPGLSTTCVGPLGELYWAGTSGSSIRIMRSDNARDPGLTPTFALTRTVAMGATVMPGFSGNPDGASGQVWVDVNRSTGPNRGHVYLLCTAGPFGTNPSNVLFVRSTDNGVTWSAPIRVNDDAAAAGHFHWFPSLSVAPGGRIDVTWNDTRDSLNANLSKLYYSSSTDEGATWSANVALTPQWNSTLGWPMQNKIGDYYDQESDNVGLSIALAATFNGEQDVYFMRINDWDCNRNGIPDSTDLALGTLHDCNGNGVPDECEAAAGIHVVCPCYPNCDASTTPPVLNVQDFSCFLNRFAAGDPWANCDSSTTPPVLNVQDFSCFLNSFATGCT